MEQVITPKSPGGFVRCLSGLFITRDNPLGLTPAELTTLSALFAILKTKDTDTIDKPTKQELANVTNTGLQTATNYVNKFKIKGVVTKDNKLHPVFFKEKITIEWSGQ